MSTIRIGDLVIQLPSDVRNLFNPSYAFGGRSFGAVIGLRDTHSGVILLPMDSEGNLIVTPGHSYDVVLITEVGNKRMSQNDDHGKRKNHSGNIQNMDQRSAIEESHSLPGVAATPFSPAEFKRAGDNPRGHPMKALVHNTEKSNEIPNDAPSGRKRKRQNRRNKAILSVPNPTEPSAHDETEASMPTDTTRMIPRTEDRTHNDEATGPPNSRASRPHADLGTKPPHPDEPAPNPTPAGPAPSLRDRSPQVAPPPQSQAEAEADPLPLPVEHRLAKGGRPASGKAAAGRRPAGDGGPSLPPVHAPPASGAAANPPKAPTPTQDDMPLLQRFAAVTGPGGSPPRPPSAPGTTSSVGGKAEAAAPEGPSVWPKNRSGRQTPQTSLPRVGETEGNVTRRRRRAPLDASSSSDAD